jgi:putative nucleotidyltransferase with HDIG domain
MRVHSTLLARFTLISLSVTVLIAVGFSWLLSRRMIEDTLNDAAQEAADIVTTTITPQVTSEDFAPPIPSRIGAWKHRIDRVIGEMDIARVKVWNTRGQVVYSDDPSLIGRSFALVEEEELREALEGRPAKDLSALKKPENAGERSYGRLIEIYVPVVLPGSREVVGAYELYRRVAPLEARISDIKKLVYGGSTAAFSLLYASLFVLVSRASRQISRQQNALERSHVALAQAYDTTLEGWSRALDLRDKETEGHSRRVTELTMRLARAIGVQNEELVHVRRGALLHDIGKMGVPDSILLKDGPLSAEETNIMQRHPSYAYDLLSHVAFLKPALDIPYCHHEKWDGTGYPRGLTGDQIPLAARIFAVADVWDALCSNRPYRAAWSTARALDYIRGHAGCHFDPQVVEVFVRMQNTKSDSTTPTPKETPQAAPPEAFASSHREK